MGGWCTWKPQSSPNHGFCIPEPLPVHTGIKELQVHPLIRFWLQSRVDEKCADLHKSLSSFICSCLASRCSQRSPSQQRFPWALQLKEQILKEQIMDGRIFFKMPFRPYPLGCGCCCLRMTDTIVVFSVRASNMLKMHSWMTHAPVVGV